MKRRNQFRIPPGSAPESLLDFLARRFTYLSRLAWEETIQRERVRVNEKPGNPAALLEAGDLVETELEGRDEPPVDETAGVVFEDDDILVVNKSGNLPCHPGGAYFNHTLWAVLKKRFRLEAPALVNRLDRETSGLVVVAKNARVGRLLSAEFSGRRAEKIYLAIVEGEFPEEVRACGAMREEQGGAIRKRRLFVEGVPPAEAGAEWSDTRFRRLATGGGISLVEAIPATGRLHQIRATLLACGFPVVGDKMYGVDPELFLRFCRGALTAEDRARLRMDRQAVHASRLRLRHSRAGTTLNLEAPLPEDMKVLMKTCGLA
jgi:23S rRNA pseudouridine955/2504/2580 synthase/23S rRNA pseudouridine1911/1915/1917 synthase